MDIKALDKALQEIVAKRKELEKMDYNNSKYDELEDTLHDQEDAFNAEYGDYLEEALQDLHDTLCPDNEVLIPTAYLGGVYVEVDKYEGKETKLVLEANPLRVVLTVGKDKQEVVWTAK
jgi:hypothetical protein